MHKNSLGINIDSDLNFDYFPLTNHFLFTKLLNYQNQKMDTLFSYISTTTGNQMTKNLLNISRNDSIVRRRSQSANSLNLVIDNASKSSENLIEYSSDELIKKVEQNLKTINSFKEICKQKLSFPINHQKVQSESYEANFKQIDQISQQQCHKKLQKIKRLLEIINKVVNNVSFVEKSSVGSSDSHEIQKQSSQLSFNKRSKAHKSEECVFRNIEIDRDFDSLKKKINFEQNDKENSNLFQNCSETNILFKQGKSIKGKPKKQNVTKSVISSDCGGYSCKGEDLNSQEIENVESIQKKMNQQSQRILILQRSLSNSRLFMQKQSQELKELNKELEAYKLDREELLTYVNECNRKLQEISFTGDSSEKYEQVSSSQGQESSDFATVNQFSDDMHTVKEISSKASSSENLPAFKAGHRNTFSSNEISQSNPLVFDNYKVPLLPHAHTQRLIQQQQQYQINDSNSNSNGVTFYHQDNPTQNHKNCVLSFLLHNKMIIDLLCTCTNYANLVCFLANKLDQKWAKAEKKKHQKMQKGTQVQAQFQKEYICLSEQWRNIKREFNEPQTWISEMTLSKTKVVYAFRKSQSIFKTLQGVFHQEVSSDSIDKPLKSEQDRLLSVSFLHEQFRFKLKKTLKQLSKILQKENLN